MNTIRQAAHVVVGGGVIGLSVAWELRRRGEDVLVVDPKPGHGASWAAAGMIAAISEQVPGEHELAELTRVSAALYPAFVDSLDCASPSGSADRGVGFREKGTLVVAMDQADVRELEYTQRLLAKDMSHYETRLTIRQARALEPALSPRISAALSVPTDQWIDPRRLCARLLEALGDSVIRARVTGIERASDGLRLRIEPTTTPERPAAHTGEILAVQSAILARGIAERHDHQQAEPVAAVPPFPVVPCTPLHPERGDIIRVRLLDPEDLPTRVIRAFVRGRQTYLVPRSDGSLVIGASVRTDEAEGTHIGSVLDLLTDAAEVFPAVRESTLLDITTRDRPATRDHLPILGPARWSQAPAHSPSCGGHAHSGVSVYWATGFDRHGVLLAPWAARALADSILDSAALPTAVDPYRHLADHDQEAAS